MLKLTRLSCAALSAAISLISFCHSASADEVPVIMGQDGAFLGVISSDKFADASICNKFGDYGDSFNEKSIRAQFGDYGSRLPASDLSAYSPNAQHPPVVMQNGQIIGCLTKNRRIRGGVDPDFIFYKVCGQ